MSTACENGAAEGASCEAQRANWQWKPKSSAAGRRQRLATQRRRNCAGQEAHLDQGCWAHAAGGVRSALADGNGPKVGAASAAHRVYWAETQSLDGPHFNSFTLERTSCAQILHPLDTPTETTSGAEKGAFLDPMHQNEKERRDSP